MSNNLGRTVLVSLVLHIFIFAYFWWKKYPPPRDHSPIEIELRESAQHTPQGDPHSLGHRRGGRPSGRTGAPAPTLGSGLKWENFRVGSAQPAAPLGQGNFTDEGNLGLEDNEWGSHGGQLGEIANFDKHQRLFTEIGGLLFFPPRLGMRSLDDTVNTRLYFTDDSQCDWQRTHVGGSHPYFQVYTLALLRKLCGMTKNMADMHYKKGEFADLSFHFELIGSVKYKWDEKPDRIIGNILLFTRTFFRPKTQIDVGPLSFDPVLGQLVSINIPWLEEHWETWVEGRDPLRDFRDP